MDLILTRQESNANGIFSTLSGDGVQWATLEHAYPVGATWQPKIPPGVYTCVRGPHRLSGMTVDFITFEITGVDGHAGLLFHWGNFNRDSEGCILVGQTRVGDMVTNSRIAFTDFMSAHTGVDSFQLTVTS